MKAVSKIFLLINLIPLTTQLHSSTLIEKAPPLFVTAGLCFIGYGCHSLIQSPVKPNSTPGIKFDNIYVPYTFAAGFVCFSLGLITQLINDQYSNENSHKMSQKILATQEKNYTMNQKILRILEKRETVSTT